MCLGICEIDSLVDYIYIHCLDKNTMNKKSRIFDVNVPPTKCSSSIRLVIYFILLWLIINTIGTFANGEPNGNFLSEGKNEKVSISQLSIDTFIRLLF